jgi:transcriptional regulator with XRE-family HTH domain
MSEFGEWLADELKERAWSSSELARRAGLSQSSVSNVLTGKQIPGLEFCKGAAKALEMPADRLLRLAGHLEYVPEAVAEEQEAVRLFRTLNEQMRGVALSVLRALQSGVPRVTPGSEKEPRTIVERMAQELARDLEALPPDDQRRVIDLMKRLRGDQGAEEADRVPLGADS